MTESQAIDQYISDHFESEAYREFMTKVIDTSATGFNLSDADEYQVMPMDQFIEYMAAYPHN